MKLTIENDKELEYFTKIAHDLSFNKILDEDECEWLLVLLKEIERYEEEHYPIDTSNLTCEGCTHDIECQHCPVKKDE